MQHLYKKYTEKDKINGNWVNECNGWVFSVALRQRHTNTFVLFAERHQTKQYCVPFEITCACNFSAIHNQLICGERL